jgi:molybdenum cofactor synthesis domain-containing protein
MRNQRVQYLGGQLSGGAHSGKAFCPVQFDRPVALGQRLVRGYSNIFIHKRHIRYVLALCERQDYAIARAMNQSRIYTAALVIIGDEILSGRTQDKNISQIALWLNIQGIRLMEVRVVPDIQEAIVEAVNTLRARNDYLFTTGGIGPTHDDITVDAIAAALGVDVVIHPEASAVLHKYYETRGGINEGRLRMARVPAGADLIANKMSGAPGIKVENVFIMAGVPHITAGMLDALTGTLEGGAPLLSQQIGCWVAESEIAGLLAQTEKAHEGCQIGSYPFFREGRVGANFVVRTTDPQSLSQCLDALKAGLDGLGYATVDGGI